MKTYRDLGLPACPCFYCGGDPDMQARGKPRPGPDECVARGNYIGCPHGHDFDDGKCMNCGMLDDGKVIEIFDHYDACAFWVGQVCDCGGIRS